MLRGIFLIITGMCCGLSGNCQLKKFYTVKNESAYDTVDFSLKATSGKCFIKPSYHSNPVTIYGNPDFEDVNPTFYSTTRGNINFIRLNLEDYKQGGLSHSIQYSMFGAEKGSEKNYWKVYLTDEKVYKLNLNYGLGDASVNLSGIPVSNLRIESGSANVDVFYDEMKANQCPMDTFFVKVDLGSISARKINRTMARHVIADVGFGTAILDFSEGVERKCEVAASIGAGSLEVWLPKEDTPAIVYFSDSPLCNISLNKGFEEVDKNVFVNRSYDSEAENLLVFNIDVALGNIQFKYVD